MVTCTAVASKPDMIFDADVKGLAHVCLVGKLPYSRGDFQSNLPMALSWWSLQRLRLMDPKHNTTVIAIWQQHNNVLLHVQAFASTSINSITYIIFGRQ